MEENKNSTKTKEQLDNMVNNYLDDIFSTASNKLNQDESLENKQLDELSKNLVEDIFKTSLNDIKSQPEPKKKKKKNKKFRLKTLTIDTKIDVIDEEDSEESFKDGTKIKREEKKKIDNKKEEKKEIKNEKKEIKEVKQKSKKHHKTNSMDLISENVIKKINNNKKLVQKLQLIKPPPFNESNDDFYLNKYINKNEGKKKSYDEICILF